MPPKKKLKVSAASKTQALAAGEDTTLSACALQDVHEFQYVPDKWIDAVHGLRHHVHGVNACEPRPPVKLSESQPGEYEWPVGRGGTLKSIAQHIWSDSNRLLEESAKMVHATGLMSSDQPDEFLQEFCTVPDLRPQT